MDKVLVTGGNGHLGYNLIKLLVDRGYKVRTSVRDKTDFKKVGHLQSLNVEIVEMDLMKPETMYPAVKGVDGVFHVASPFKIISKKPEEEVIDPIVNGYLNILKASKDEGVKKFILTSSVVAIGTICSGENPLTEETWNKKPVNPYSKAKTQAEKIAWDFSNTNSLNMIAILPATIIGPYFHRHTPSTILFERLLKGELPFILPFTFNFVDVRDVAKIHLSAYEDKNAKGRYIVSNKTLSLSELFQIVHSIYPDIKIPGRKLSNNLLYVAPLFDYIYSAFTGKERLLSLDLIKEYANKIQSYSNEKIVKEFSFSPIPIEETIKDTIEWMVNANK